MESIIESFFKGDNKCRIILGDFKNKTNMKLINKKRTSNLITRD